jgi:pimeloyl-ACP methyl ester carboxylesterase
VATRETEAAGAGSIRSEELTLHGHRVTYQIGGDGPVLVLVHGIAGSSATWDDVLPRLAERHTVIAPDLLGHGQSAKPRGDYSLGAYASGLRDVLAALGVERATFVGHSLGGGVAMQFAYQFPERLERLALVASGGLGREVSLLLRSVALPGAEYVLPLLCASPMRQASGLLSRAVRAIGLRPGPDVEEIALAFASFADTDARQAFVQTARSIIDLDGQRVDARDRLYLASEVPTLLVWGERDRIIPVAHGREAHELIEGSRLEVFGGAGHFPHRDDPDRFVRTIADFVAGTDAYSQRKPLEEILGSRGLVGRPSGS